MDNWSACDNRREGGDGKISMVELTSLDVSAVVRKN